jgi:hypothetical protein
MGAELVAGLPQANHPAVEIGDYFDAEHAAVITAVYLSGLAVIFFLGFLGVLAARLRAAGEAGLAGTALGAFVVWVLISGVLLLSEEWRAPAGVVQPKPGDRTVRPASQVE